METKPIKLIFTFNREVMQFVVLNKEVYYTDKVWKSWIRCIPKNKDIVRKIMMSRNKLPIQLLKMFDLSENELKEYNEAETDEELAKIIIKDARLKGCKHEKTIMG